LIIASSILLFWRKKCRQQLRYKICVIRSLRISALQAETTDNQTRTELDSHADTCVLGDNALIIEDFEKPVEVSGYLLGDGTRKCKTVTGVLGCEDPKDGSLQCKSYTRYQGL
jgi:hypothetical protein